MTSRRDFLATALVGTTAFAQTRAPFPERQPADQPEQIQPRPLEGHLGRGRVAVKETGRRIQTISPGIREGKYVAGRERRQQLRAASEQGPVAERDSDAGWNF